LADEPLPLFNPDTAYHSLEYPGWKARVEQADVLLLATPDYHGSISSTMKNFLDHFWHEFAGKLFATVVASHEKGLTELESRNASAVPTRRSTTIAALTRVGTAQARP